MQSKTIIQSQYRASLAMLRQTIEKCSESLWEDDSYVNPFWRIAYHALIYTHFYLSKTEADFLPWEKHKEGMQLLGSSAPEAKAYSRVEILKYLEFCMEHVEKQVEVTELEAESGFNWLPFNKLELQIYNIRHIMLHTGELCERLGAHGEIEVDWIGMQS